MVERPPHEWEGTAFECWCHRQPTVFVFFFLMSRDVPQPGTPLFTSHLERGPLRDLPKSLGAPSATTALVK